MPARILAAASLVLAIAACSGGAPATAVTPTDVTGNPAASGPAATSGATSGAGATVDLSGLDVCNLIDEATVSALTGVSGFTTSSRDNTHCFWAVPKPGVPQYLEVDVSARPNGIGDYDLSFPQNTCTSVPVSAADLQAKGGDCTGPQHKVYVIAWAQGVMVSVLVNEPPAGTTPAGLLEFADGVLREV